MKFKKIMMICILLLAILTIGAVSAQDASDVLANDSAVESNDTPVNEVSENQENDLYELIEDEDYRVYIRNLSDNTISFVEVKGMPWDASGNISISIDGKEQYNQKVQVSGNALILNDLNLAPDFHDVSIAYSGDGKYSGFVRNASFGPFFEVSCNDVFLNDGYLDVYTMPNLPGNIKIVIDNKVVYNKAGERNIEINLNKYSLGTHSYEVFYDSKSIKKDTFNHASFYVWSEAEDGIEYGSPAKFSIDLSKKATGFAKFKGIEYPFEFDVDADEYVYGAQVEVSGFDVGENIVEFHYQNQAINYSVFVSPKVIMPTKLWANGSYKLIFNASSDLNGDLVLSGFMNGTFKVNDGFAEVPIPKLGLGKYALNVKYENYTWDYDVTVSGETPKMSFGHYFPSVVCTWDWIFDWEDTYEYQIYLDSNGYLLTGKTKVYDEKGRTAVYEGGINGIVFTPDLSDIGKHTITVSYEGDDNFEPVNYTINYEVADFSCSIECDGAYVCVPGDAVGTLTVYINGTKIKSVKFKGEGDIYDSAWVTFPELEKNVNYTVDVIFKGDKGKYSFNHTETLVIGVREDISFYLDVPDEMEWYNEKTIDLRFPNDIEKEPVVRIDDEIHDYLVDQGDDCMFFNVDISDLALGSHNILVTYEGDSLYLPTSENATFNVIAKIHHPDEDYHDYGSMLTVSLALPDDAVGNLSVEIKYDDESDYSLYDTAAIEYGQAEIDLPSDRVGEYYYNAYFKGNYEVENYSSSIWVVPIVSSLKIKYGDEGKITVSMDGMSDAKLALSIEDDAEHISIAEFDLNESKVITIDKELVYKARSLMKMALKDAISEGYSPYIYLYVSVYTKDAVFSDLRTVEVSFASKITGLSNVNMQYSAGKTLTLKVYDIFGKLVKSGETVKIKIGKKTFTAKAGKNGVVKFKIPNTVTPGKYTITATYKDFKVSKKLTVKQILTVKTVKVKKSAKKLVLTATLKKVNGKYLKGKKITFKFNGKTYKAKTNKKGVAKVTIKKSVLKKLKVGKNVKYQATYLKDTVKKSAKVKK